MTATSLAAYLEHELETAVLPPQATSEDEADFVQADRVDAVVAEALQPIFAVKALTVDLQHADNPSVTAANDRSQQALAEAVAVFAHPEELNKLIQQRINKELKFYDGESHLSMFHLPKFVRQGIKGENRINRDATPVFMV